MQKSAIKELFLYLLVGGLATLTEWAAFFLLGLAAVHYAPATILAYLLSTFINWLAGRWLIFKERRLSLWKELAGVYLASLLGLLLNLLIMWVAVDLLTIPEMLSKIAATALVFAYNFLVRKLLIYRKK